MNGSSGPALAARLKAIRPEIRVLFVSSYAHDHLDCTELGKDRLQVLEKPFSGATLLERVQQLLKDNPPACE
jgi:CheY-like chemotaxis protein